MKFIAPRSPRAVISASGAIDLERLTTCVRMVLLFCMATVRELRETLLKHRVSRALFAKECGMTLSEFNAMMKCDEELPSVVMVRLGVLLEGAKSKAASKVASKVIKKRARLSAEVGRRLVNPYVREIILAGDARASLQVSPEFDLRMGSEVYVKRVKGEESWVYELDGPYNRRGELMEVS